MTEGIDGQESAELYARQTIESYAALGQYVQVFEQLVERIRVGCQAFLGDSNYAKIAMHHSSLTAMPLFQILRAMIATETREHHTRFSDEDISVVNRILPELGKMMENAASQRNKLLHGTWFIGWASQDQTDFSKIAMHKIQVAKDGYRVDSPVKTTEDLADMRNRCEYISSLIDKLLGCLCLSRTSEPSLGYISANIAKTDDLWTVTSPRGTYNPPMQSGS